MNVRHETQKEFFNEFAENARPRRRHIGAAGVKKVYTIRLSNEQLAFACIGLIIFLVVCFSLGVEKGKRTLVPVKTQIRAKTVMQKEPEPVAIVKERPVPDAKIAPKSDKNSPYAIQVAAYTDSKQAKSEKVLLEKKGHTAQIKTSGKYLVVYVVGFKTWKEADVALPGFRDRYKDCFIKRR